MRVDHRCADIRVTEQLLNRANVRTRLEQVRRKGVTKRMTRHALRETRTARGAGDGAMYDGHMNVVTPADTSAIDERPTRRKDVRPRPTDTRAGILSLQRGRKPRATNSQLEVAKMEPLSLTQMATERRGGADSQRYSAILVAFPRADNNLAPIEIDVSNAQR